jgi:hypothetical protein
VSEAGPTPDVAPDPAPDGDLSALVAEAGAKSDLLWVRVPGGRAWPAWHIWREGSAYVVSGPAEQPLPPLVGDVEVILRSKDTWARLLTLRAVALTLTPDDEDWPEIAAALKASRLNAPDPDHLLDRWAAANTVTRLTPGGVALESPGSYDDSSGAAPPAPTEATTTRWAPWHLRGRRNTRRNNRRAARRG